MNNPDNLLLDVTQKVVLLKLQELKQTPQGAIYGRVLTIADLKAKGHDLTPDQLQVALSISFADVADRLGIQFFQALPPAALEQFTLMSIMRNEDCAGLLKSLINSFMVTYMTQATSAAAFGHLEGLEALRKQVAVSRGLTPMPMAPHAGSSTQ
ncbi:MULTISPECIES: hypothetical protein [Pseudomonas]|uniref:Uncharacterized protein n=1 Tax=Pseudomonas fluorescens TaxID=294 RepID=A0A161ZG19_PSEFL|nr:MULTISPECIES: hypothetical protein [Pseudomonas]KZN20812.1 hypothetical protein A1D17_04525 [Pseudomonas fluorescens]